MKKNLLHVISTLDSNNIIKFNAVEVIEEKEHEFVLLDKINDKNTFSKEDLDKEFEFLFVTKDIKKIREQLKRIYENIRKKIEDETSKLEYTEDDMSKLEYKINKLKYLQEINKQNYEDDIEVLEKMKR